MHPAVEAVGQEAAAAVRVRPGSVMRASVLAGSLVLILALSSGSAEPGNPVSSNPTEQSGSPWIKDLDYFALELPRLHKDLFFKISPEEFGDQVDALRSEIPDLKEYEIVVELMKIVAAVGDSHTMVGANLPGVFSKLPAITQWFSDGLYVVRTAPEYRDILGTRLAGIEGIPIEGAEQALAAVIPHENEAQLKNRFPHYLAIPQILAALGLVANPDTVRLNIDSLGEFSLVPLPMDSTVHWISVSDSIRCDTPLYLQHPDSHYWFTALGDSAVLYVKYSACTEMRNHSFASFTQDLFDFADSHPPDKFILDIRSNGGGNSAIAQPLIDGVRQRPNLNRERHLFVIIGRKTFSSALLNALSFRTETSAIFVGEATGGKPNHYGEVGFFALPNSRITVTYSTKYFQVSPEDTPSLYPDIEVGTSFSDLMACRDPVLEVILDYR